ncbi:MAG: rRNA maturation RNase YbeY [Bacteroidetes bacterium]|nr:rRNA maturation RNase YbeY [Bacteroidota bacterium]
MAISFHNADISFKLEKKVLLKKFIADTFQKECGKKLSASYVFCSDAYLLGINQSFLQHDYYTDIITFPLSETDSKVVSEIYISIDRVIDNAKKHKVEGFEELHRVMFHGALHLAGYKDKTRAQQSLMRQKEDEWIDLFKKSH